MPWLKFIAVLNTAVGHYCFTELVHRTFKCGDMQRTSLALDKELKNLIDGSPFYVIMYRSYELVKAVRFFGPPYK